MTHSKPWLPEDHDDLAKASALVVAVMERHPDILPAVTALCQAVLDMAAGERYLGGNPG